MSEREEGFAVVLSRPEALQPPAIANVLGAFRKMPFQDAIRIARNCWGVVLEGLARKEAEDLMGRLNDAGMQSFVTHPSLLAGFPELRPVKKASVGPEGLGLLDGELETVAWDRVLLLAAAGVSVTEQRKIKVKEGPDAADRALNIGIMLATGLPIKVGKQEKEVEKTIETTDLLFYLDLFLKEPARRLRIDGQNFDFSCLRERKLYNVLGNLRLLVGDLVAFAPAAARNRGTRVLAENRPIREMGYLTLEDLDRESRWLLTLIRRASP